jgi:peptide/nickel transport system substrate-binding protein
MESGGGYWDKVRSKQLRRRSLIQLGGLAAGVGTLAACGVRTGSQSSSSSSSSSGASSGTPKQGGIVNMPVPADPFDWDPTYVGPGLPNTYGFVNAYNSVVGYKVTPGMQYDELTLQPELAQSYEVPDAQTYIFHMRPGVKFANVAPVNGRAMTSDDVKFSFEYTARSGQFKSLPQSQYDYFFEGMSGIDTPDPSTAIVKFSKPFVPFLNYAASRWVPVYAHEIYDQDGHFKDKIAGTGPFQLDLNSSQKGTKYVWKKNPTYWESGKPYLDQVNWLVLKDDAAQNTALQTKQIDLLFAMIDPGRAQTLTKAAPTLVATHYNYPAPMHLYMNLKDKALNDLRVRQAIALTIDRDAFLKTLFNGGGGWGMAGAFPDTFTQDELKKLLKTDVAQAKQLMAAAGYANGVDLQFNYPGNAYGDQYITQMQLLQSQLKQIGVNLQLNALDKDDESTRKKQHNFTITDTSKSIQGDVDSYLYAAFYPGNRANYTGVDDPQLTPLLEQQRAETNAQKRNDIVRQAAIRINTDQYWAEAIYLPVYYELTTPRMKGYVPYFGSPGLPVFTNVWVDG